MGLLLDDAAAAGSKQVSRYASPKSYDTFDYLDDHLGNTGGVGGGSLDKTLAPKAYVSHSSGYGSSGGDDCCPLVVDPLTFAATLGTIGLSTFLLNTYFTRNSAAILMAATGGRRKRGLLELASHKNKVSDVFWHGELSTFFILLKKSGISRQLCLLAPQLLTVISFFLLYNVMVHQSSYSGKTKYFFSKMQ